LLFLLPQAVRSQGAESEHSWTVTCGQIEAKHFDLKAVNPNARREHDTRTPEELLDLIEAKGREVAEALAALRSKSSSTNTANCQQSQYCLSGVLTVPLRLSHVVSEGLRSYRAAWLDCCQCVSLRRLYFRSDYARCSCIRGACSCSSPEDLFDLTGP
jgi:hypothetical protein